MAEISAPQSRIETQQLTFGSLLEFSLNEITDIFQRCFEGYLVPIALTPVLKTGRLRRDSTDLTRSFVILSGGEPVSMAFLAPRYDRMRLAGMGVVASARGQGVGRAAVAEFLRRSREAGCREAVLEVFEQNEAAFKLYSSFGFAVSQRLYGYSRAGTQPMPAPIQLAETSARDYVRAVSASEDSLPWFHESEQAALISLPTRCWTLDGTSLAIFSPPSPGGTLVLQGFYTRADARRQGKGSALISAIEQHFAPARWMLPQIFPEAVEPFWLANGFERMPLNQFEMRLTL